MTDAVHTSVQAEPSCHSPECKENMRTVCKGDMWKRTDNAQGPKDIDANPTQQGDIAHPMGACLPRLNGLVDLCPLHFEVCKHVLPDPICRQRQQGPRKGQRLGNCPTKWTK